MFLLELELDLSDYFLVEWMDYVIWAYWRLLLSE